MMAVEVVRSPLKHATGPDDVAAGVLGVIEGGDYITGQTIHINGAWLNY